MGDGVELDAESDYRGRGRGPNPLPLPMPLPMPMPTPIPISRSVPIPRAASQVWTLMIHRRLLSGSPPSGRLVGAKAVLGRAAGEEGFMPHPFHVYGAALGLVSALRPVLGQLAKADRSLADQLRRAASSVVLNLAEGNRRTGKDRIHVFRIAAGSAAEVKAALDVAEAWGMVGPAVEADRELDRVLAMLWRLTHPRHL